MITVLVREDTNQGRVKLFDHGSGRVDTNRGLVAQVSVREDTHRGVRLYHHGSGCVFTNQG